MILPLVTVATLVTLAAATVPLVPATQSGTPERATSPIEEVPLAHPEALAWIKSHAIEFTTPEAGHGFDDLEPLARVIGDARVVSLGEPTHGTREAFQFKHRLLEYLVERHGFSIFSIEASMPESYALNDYVIEGRGDPKKLIAGMYFWTWNTEEVLAMVKWMREWNLRHPDAPHKLQFTGFDMQTPDVALRIVRDFLAAHARELMPGVQTLDGESKELASRRGAGSSGTGPIGAGWTSATGTFPAAEARGKKLRLSLWIRTDDVRAIGAPAAAARTEPAAAEIGGWVGAWWRCDTNTSEMAFNNMHEQEIRGTTPWTRYEFSLEVPKDTHNIHFGLILAGDGAAWFDDIEVELDGVKFEDAQRFSFDFEREARWLMPTASEYSSNTVETQPHGGARCFEIRRRPAGEISKIDAQAVIARANTLVDSLSARRDEFVDRAGAHATEWAIQNARVLAQNAAMVGTTNGFNIRDASMATNVRWILEQNPGQKIVLWAHNGHVSRAGYMQMVSMGRALSDALRDQMVVFGFAAGAGTYTAIAGIETRSLRSDNELVAPVAESVEAYLSAAGLRNAVIDLRGASAEDAASNWAVTPRPMRSIGALATPIQFFPCVPRDMFDVLVWQANTTASRPLN